MRSKQDSMTGFVGRLAAFASLQLLVASIVFWQGSPRDSNHYLSALQDKIERLESCVGNRILVVGGSNAAFGFDSQCIQQTTGLDTVNLGLHVSLGLPFYLETIRQHCRDGEQRVSIECDWELLNQASRFPLDPAVKVLLLRDIGDRQ